MSSRPDTILIVDDERALATLMARMLEEEGYVAVPLRSTRQALEFLAGDRPCDLVIIDIRMPEMSGFELAERAREHRPLVPVLFVSGYVDPDYLGRGGFHDFLAKPFTQAELLAAVRRLLPAPATPRPETLERNPVPTSPAPPRATGPPS